MSIFLVLDILLILLVALFMPIGFWRGPIKESFVTLGITFGVLLADYWARPWGRDLTDFTSLRADGGAFIVAMIFLIASTFILGYGLGGALAPAEFGPLVRALGAAVAAFNGILLLSFSLQYVRLFLLSDANEESLNDSYVARFLLDQIGWVLMFVGLAVVPLLLYLLATGRRAYEEPHVWEAPDEGWETAPRRTEIRRADAGGHSLPPRVPAARPEEPAHVYKAEPEPRPRRATEATRPLQVPEQRVTAEPEPGGDSGKMSDTDPHIVIPAPVPPVESSEDTADSDMAPGYSRCRVCRAVLAPGTSICPNCGTMR